MAKYDVQDGDEEWEEDDGIMDEDEYWADDDDQT